MPELGLTYAAYQHAASGMQGLSGQHATLHIHTHMRRHAAAALRPGERAHTLSGLQAACQLCSTSMQTLLCRSMTKCKTLGNPALNRSSHPDADSI